MPQKRTIPRVCETCGNGFLATGISVKQGLARFCSNACKYEWRRGLLTGDPIERFWSKVDKSGGPDACWPFLGNTESNGYARFWFNGTNVGAHRFAYEATYGPIPEGCQVDHVRARGCVRRDCCNPTHLEAVTPLENTMRAETITAINARKTHCIHGHEFTPENTLYSERTGKRSCRACVRVSWQRYDAKRRKAA